MFDRLSDEELRPIMRAADALPMSHRELFLQRVAAHLHLHGRSAVDEAVQPCGGRGPHCSPNATIKIFATCLFGVAAS